MLAGQDKLRVLERGLNTSYWDLLLAEGAWLVTAALWRHHFSGSFASTRFLMELDSDASLGIFLERFPCVGSRPMATAARLGPRDTAILRSLTERLAQQCLLFAFQIWDYSVTVADAHACGYFTRVREQELERAELQQALAASELQAVKSQLHPHFLFHTLQGISALTDTDNRRAKAMPTQLRMRTSKTCPSRRGEISTR